MSQKQLVFLCIVHYNEEEVNDMLTSQELSNFLSNQDFLMYWENEQNKNRMYESVKLFDGISGETVPEKGTLYVLSADDLCQLCTMPSFSYANLVIVKPPEEKKLTLDKLYASYYLIETTLTSKEILKMIHCHMHDHYLLMNQRDMLMQTLLNTDDMEELIDESSKILNNPIVVIDKSFRVLAHSDIQWIRDDYWKKSIQNGFCSHEFITRIRQMETFQHGNKERHPFFMTCDIDHTEKLVSKLYLDGLFMGYAIVLDSVSAVCRKDLPLVGFLGKIIIEQMKVKHQYVQNMQASASNFYIELLDEMIQSEAALQDRLQSIQMEVRAPFRMALIIDHSFNLSKEHRENIVGALQEHYLPLVLAYYDDYLVVFFPDDDQMVEIIRNTVMKHDCIVIISGVVSQYLKTSKIYHSCVSTLHLLNKMGVEKGVYYNDDYRCYHLFQDVSSQHQLIQYCHPKVLEIQRYDQAHETNFFETVSAYCRKGRNIMAAAEELYIHRNTMRYRLTKIEKLFGLSLEPEEVFHNVLISIKILDYIAWIDVAD